jgi:hypothetical protein
MRDSTTPPDQGLILTKTEDHVIRSFRNNPLMAEKITSLVKRYEQEIADGMDAHHAEETFITELQNLGTSMMRQWAEMAQKNELEKRPKTHRKHAKKNSTGIPPLD